MKKHKILRLCEFRYEIMRILCRVDSQKKLPIQTNVLVPFLQKSVHAIKIYDQNKSWSSNLNTLYEDITHTDLLWWVYFCVSIFEGLVLRSQHSQFYIWGFKFKDLRWKVLHLKFLHMRSQLCVLIFAVLFNRLLILRFLHLRVIFLRFYICGPNFCGSYICGPYF